MASIVDRTLTAGDSFSYVFNMKDVNGVPTPLVGYTVRMQLRSKTTGSVVIDAVGTINSIPPTDESDPTTGKTQITINLLPTDTENLVHVNSRRAIFLYDIELSSPDGLIVKTVLKGKFIVERDITR